MVVFTNAETPLAPAMRWDPATTPPTTDYIDNDLPAYFGLGPGADPTGGVGFDLHRNQVFDRKYFVGVAKALQAAQASGNGVVATTELTTIANKWYGVPAGITANVTWVYLSRAANWEKQLSPDLQKLLVPPGSDAGDPSKAISSGLFKNFPYYSDLTQYDLTIEQINVEADLSGWVLKANKGTLDAALRG